MKHLARILVWGFVAAQPYAFTSTSASAAEHCLVAWAKPGTYIVTAKFKGSVQSAHIYLTNDCRMVIPLPGVFTGGRLARAGHCLKFNFKVQGQRQVFTARWCDGYGVIPWGDRTIRIAVNRKLAPSERQWKKQQNFDFDLLRRFVIPGLPFRLLPRYAARRSAGRAGLRLSA